MNIDNFEQINALNKLLYKVRFSDHLDSDDIDFFATSPIIVEIHNRLFEEWIRISKDKGYLKNYDIENNSFEFDGPIGKILRNRIDYWDYDKVNIFKNWTDNQIKDYIILMISPAKIDNSDLIRMINYIKTRVKMDCSDKLFVDYVSMAIEHEVAIEKGDSKIANKIHNKLTKITENIKKLGSTEHRFYFQFLSHDNLSVRLWTAIELSGTFPDKSLEILKQIQSSKSIIGLTAKTSIDLIHKGMIKKDNWIE